MIEHNNIVKTNFLNDDRHGLCVGKQSGEKR